MRPVASHLPLELANDPLLVRRGMPEAPFLIYVHVPRV